VTDQAVRRCFGSSRRNRRNAGCQEFLELGKARKHNLDLLCERALSALRAGERPGEPAAYRRTWRIRCPLLYMSVDLRANRVLMALDGDDLALLSPYLKEVSLRPGQILQEQEALVEEVYFPLNSVISLISVMEGGDQAAGARLDRVPSRRRRARPGGIGEHHLRVLRGHPPSRSHAVFTSSR
jgi:hypothetical protein